MNGGGLSSRCEAGTFGGDRQGSFGAVRTIGEDENNERFSVAGAQTASTPLVFNSPHSGRRYSSRFLAQTALSQQDIRRSEDAFVDELFAAAPSAGAVLLCAHFPRAYIDVNRDADELDPRLFEERLPAHAITRSPRVTGGLGVIPRLVAEGVEIYRGRLPLAEAGLRIETCYRPYHAALRALVENARDRHGMALLVDCHSMPSSIRSATEPFRPDFIVGDRFGRAAGRAISEAVIGLLTAMGYKVAHNKPYAGGHITEHYGCPGKGVHAVQVEINRGLYMDERDITMAAGFDLLKRDLDLFIHQLAVLAGDFQTSARLAAE